MEVWKTSEEIYFWKFRASYTFHAFHAFHAFHTFHPSYAFFTIFTIFTIFTFHALYAFYTLHAFHTFHAFHAFHMFHRILKTLDVWLIIFSQLGSILQIMQNPCQNLLTNVNICTRRFINLNLKQFLIPGFSFNRNHYVQIYEMKLFKENVSFYCSNKKIYHQNWIHGTVLT